MKQEVPLSSGSADGVAVGIYRRGVALLSRYRHMNWAMADQGMVSGINFLTGILLARYLGLAEFGLFTLAWMAVEFLITFQQCLIVAPMMSIGPQTAVDQRRAYFGAVVAQQALFLVVSACVFLGVIKSMGILKPAWNLDGLILPLLCAALAAQLQNFFRRYLFTRVRGGAAFLIDVVRYSGQLVVLLPLVFMMKLDAADVLWIFALTSGLSAGLGCLCLEPVKWDSTVFRKTFRRHWDFAKWLLLSEIMRWGTTNLYMAVAGALLGTAVVGAIRTAQILLGVCNILSFGIENFALVRASQHFRDGGAAALLGYLKRLMLFGSFAIGGVVMVVAVAPEFWLGLVNEEYRSYGDLVRWWALLYFISFLRKPLEFGLRTIEQTRTMFWAHLAGALISVATVYPMINGYGATGVMAGIGLITFVRLLLLLYGVRRQLILPMQKTAS